MTPATGLGRRALLVTALAAALFAALLAAGSARATYTAHVESDTLLIVGNGDSDQLVLRLRAGDPTILEVDVGADGTADFSFDRSTFTAIDVRARDGDDEVRIDQSSGAFADELVTINGGAGADTLLGGLGAETLIGGGGDDFVDGNQGTDTALLGGGADRFQWDPGDSSDVVEGQAGHDTLAFNGSNIGENMQVSANGPRVRFTRNIASIVMDLAGIDEIDVRTFGGADNVVVDDLTGTDAPAVNVDLNLFGGADDGQPDSVTANGTDAADAFKIGSGAGGETVVIGPASLVQATGGEEALDNIVAAGLGGDDTLTVAVGAASGPVPVNFDGGGGADTARYNGTPGDDEIQVVANGFEASVVSTGTSRLDVLAENLVVSGLDGADIITAVGNLAPLTQLTMNGGLGNDSLLGGNGADTLLGGAGDDFVDGNQGADTALLGGGADTFQWDPGDSNDVVEGQAGLDTLAFNGSNIGENMDVSANGARVRFTRNIASIVMDLAGVEQIDVRTLGGADNVVVNDLAGTELKTVRVDLDAFGGAGDGQPDTVTANGSDLADAFKVGSAGSDTLVTGPTSAVQVTGGEEALDNIVAAGLDGDDTLTLAVGSASGPVPVNLDGGTGTDTARYNGTLGDDVIQVVANGAEASVVSTGTSRLDVLAESLIVSGLDGADTISGVGNLAALTSITMQGGVGPDTIFGGNGSDLLLGGTGDDFVDGNQGADTALLGGGADRFQWDPGDGNDVIEGEAGSDTLDFNGSNIGEIIDVSANGERVSLTRNIASIAMDLNGVEAANVLLRGGADRLTVADLRGTDLVAVDADLSLAGSGDAAADTVVVNGTDLRDVVDVSKAGSEVLTTGLHTVTRISGSEPANDMLLVQTLAGNDDVTVAPDVSDLISTVVDLGVDE
jgi:Ca2+-binding RTX toxin-like protein